MSRAVKGVYSVNGMFGTENSESISRVKLYTKNASTKKLCDKVLKAQLDGGAAGATPQTFKVSMENFMVWQNLLWQGVLHE